MANYDTGSEDGQLRSPGDELMLSAEEHDTDSLDIKPPQANVAYSRDSTGSRRKEKTSKEKKHSKERKHKDRVSGGGSVSGRGEHSSGGERNSTRGVDRDKEKERERRSDPSRKEHNRVSDERRSDVVERYQQLRGGYEDGREMVTPNNERRYQKHYDRTNDYGGGVGGGRAVYHHHQSQQSQQQQQQYHQIQMQRQHRQDYYERSQNYHHHHVAASGPAGDYHNNRQIYMQRERRKYSYEEQKDPESLEQDLRSRLLSKRHKYVKTNDTDEHYEMRAVDRHNTDRIEKSERSYEYVERERSEVETSERHRMRRIDKTKENIIEVLDSPDVQHDDESNIAEEDIEESRHQRRKHKRRNKEKADGEVIEKRKTPDDPELLARREKFLAAEREKEKRKDAAREELEARRRERVERAPLAASDALSPSAVAASVTAGLNVVVKRKQKSGKTEHVNRKRARSSKHNSDIEAVDDDDEYDEENSVTEDSDSADSLSPVGSEQSYKMGKLKRKLKKAVKDTENSDGAVNSEDDEEIQALESPLSIGELSKSPPKRPKLTKKKRKQKKHTSDNEFNDNDDEDYNEDVIRTSRSRSRSEHSASRSGSHSQTSRSRSRTVSSRSSHRSRSRSSRSASATSRSPSRSPRHRTRSSSSRSRSRSRSRSEERDMKVHQRKADAEAKVAALDKKIPEADGDGEGENSPALDEKGVPLPNYYPGIQGCRSVEEFQCLNRIEEGTYGVVYRAKDKRTNEIVALKRLKMEKEKEGFPITSLREINTLLKGQHPNIVTVREIVVGSNMDKIFIVMDYVEHDLKSLMETMKTRKQSFFPGEVKCLIQQLLCAVGHLHDNWILHRDLKTSNLLLSHKGILKVGDFGLAREYGSPLKKYTSLVVTLWYRAPELLLCAPEYSTPIDIWSVGCIFAEFLQMLPLFPGKSEVDQLNRIFKELGTPNEKIWPGYKDLPAVKNLINQNPQFADYPVSNVRKHFADKTSETGIALLQGLLTYDPKQRLSADAALKHAYFKELPLPIDPSMFPTWPAKSELGARKAMASSPKPPSGGSQFKQLGRDDIIATGAAVSGAATGKAPISGIITGNKKTATNTGFVLNAGIEQRQLAMGPGFSLKF